MVKCSYEKKDICLIWLLNSEMQFECFSAKQQAMDAETIFPRQKQQQHQDSWQEAETAAKKMAKLNKRTHTSNCTINLRCRL